MSHSFNKIWVHAIWSTKNRIPLIRPEFENVLYQVIGEQLRGTGCPVGIINGMPDHVHCLFMLNPQRSITDVIKQVKGGSSHHLNQSNLISKKFAWQTGYAAYALSESQLNRVFRYIREQKRHHQARSFSQEYKDFLRLNGFNPDDDDDKNG